MVDDAIGQEKPQKNVLNNDESMSNISISTSSHFILMSIVKMKNIIAIIMQNICICMIAFKKC